MSLNLTYPQILAYFSRYAAGNRTESRAFLAWFLDSYYRLDETEAQDCVCDGPDDKGVDAIYVDHNLEVVDIFQSKLFKRQDKTLGDADLREFVGSLAQFGSGESIQHVIETTGNAELKKLIQDQKIKELVEQGFNVRGVFVTNVPTDANADRYVAGRQDIIIFSRPELIDNYVPSGPTEPVSGKVNFKVDEAGFIDYRTADAESIIASIKASELIQMEGISSGRLFHWNLRQSLGRTKVNKAIAKSIEVTSEHKQFMLYHNGVTVLCQMLEENDGLITIDGYTVVNGCQSVTTLYEQKGKLSPELRLITRFIKVPPDSELAANITNRTNNQNSIKPRDFQSNSATQKRLKTEFERTYPGTIFYQIKRGETSDAPEIIDNEHAARVVLAFDLQRPWQCHQTYRLLDDLHTELFARPEVTAARIVAFTDLYTIVDEAIKDISDQLIAGYTLTKFFLLYLLRRALETDETGKAFCRNPAPFINSPNGREKMKSCAKSVLADIIVDFNAEVEGRAENDDPFDYKRELKNSIEVRNVAAQVIAQYQKLVRRNRVPSFSEEWEKISSGG